MTDRPGKAKGWTLTRWLDERAARKWVERMTRNRPRYEAAFERWANARPRRRQLYEEIVKATGASSRGARFVARPRLDKAQVARNWWFTEIVATPAFASLAVLLVAAVALYFALPMFTGQTDKGSKAPYAVKEGSYRTGIGQVRTIDLADGSRVTLDTDSFMRVRYMDNRRDITLIRGRARFEVAHDKTRPFVVFANNGKVVATGTLFDVTVRGGFGVQLLEGSVDVTLPPAHPGVTPSRSLRLDPGQKISFTAGEGPLIVTPRKVRPSDQQWVSGVKTFDDVPASEIIAEANSYSTVKLAFADAALADRLVVVQCDIRNISEVGDKLAEQFGLKVDRSQVGKLILK